jgi:tetratricopeptide (TPR) repeat protein
MNLSEIKNLKILGLIGSGLRGSVHAARDAGGEWVAVKVFDGMMINRGLLSKALARLEHGGWPDGLVRVLRSDLDARPAYWVMPLMSDEHEKLEPMEWTVRSLQHRIDAYPGAGTWELIRSIASALAAMHAKRVAHGNLKPGNVFFDKSGNVQLADWGLVSLPGMSSFEFSDALLYQSPEQLLEPGGYLDEAGYRWDVFAFGVLAFRLMMGAFPRCNEVFSAVAPVMGETRKLGIEADIPEIARSLQLEPEIRWPREPKDELEKNARDWIGRCLMLNPEDRPASMIEVSNGLDAVDSKVAAESARQDLMQRCRHAERASRSLKLFLGLAATGMLVFAGLFQMSHDRLAKEQTDYLREKERMGQLEREMVATEKELEQQLKITTEMAVLGIRTSREVADQLFEWVVDAGHKNLPPLTEREQRIKMLESYYVDFLQKHARVKGLAEELSRVRLQLAEVTLAADDEENAETRLEDAVKKWEGEMNARTKLRVAKNRLSLALLKQRAGREDLSNYFTKAWAALDASAGPDADVDRIKQLRAILDYHEARWLAKNGQEDKAMEQLLRAARALNELVEGRPDAAVIRSELASCYISSAVLFEDRGKLGDARETRILAVKELETILNDDPGNVPIRLELAGCYAAVADTALTAGDVETAAKFAQDALKLLDEVLKEVPDSRTAIVRKAGLLGIQGVLLRDQGKQDEARNLFETGIGLLENVSEHPMRDYRLAILYWQKGRMLGFAGDAQAQIDLLAKADDALRILEEELHPEGPTAESLKRSRGYLLGDYALALEGAGEPERSREAYLKAAESWEKLLEKRTDNEEYADALEWVRERLKKE